MKKKIIIAGAILIVLASGLGVSHAYFSNKETAHTSSNKKYYAEDTGSLKKVPLPTSEECLTQEQLPVREKTVVTPDSIFCLVNKDFSLPSDYVPKDLVIPDVPFSIDYESEKKYMRKTAAQSLEEMFDAAKKEGLELTAVSGYRSYKRQKEIYEKNLKAHGTTHTNQYSAKPGYSEHQTGLVMDVSCKSENYDLQESFGETSEGIWLAENAHLFGYIIRYPEDKCKITGYAYEPWHLRYVGIAMSTYLYQNHMTLDEYYHYKPSYEFITDENQYSNDTPQDDTVSSNYPSYSPPSPSASSSTARANNSSNTVLASKVPVATPSTKPAAQKPSANVTPVSKEPEITPSEAASEKPAASVMPSTKPSEKATVKTSKAPAPSEAAPAPSPAAPSKAPQPPAGDDDTDNDATTSDE